MKKNMIILAASLVMTLTISGAVTNLVKGREEEPKARWVQMAEDALEMMGKTDVVPANDPVIIAEESAGIRQTPAEAEESAVSGEGSGTAPDQRPAEAKKKGTGTIIQGTSETPVAAGQATAEEVPPDAASEPPSAPKTPVEAKDAATGTETKQETSAQSLAPEPDTKSQTTAPGGIPQGRPTETAEESPQSLPTAGPEKQRKDIILQLTNAAEHRATRLQENYAEDLGDGRGITFGIIGFTTGAFDGNVLIKHYTTLNKDNILAQYIPALDAIDSMPHTGNEGDSVDSTVGLDGLYEAIQKNTDPLFLQAQMDKLDERYWNPSAKLSDNIGAQAPLTQAFLYDMMVNHGQDGAQNFINKANYALGGTPGTGIDENTYLMKLMDLRETYLNNTGNPGADRVAAFRRILTSGNVGLDTPFSFTVYGDTFRIEGDIPRR